SPRQPFAVLEPEPRTERPRGHELATRAGDGREQARGEIAEDTPRTEAVAIEVEREFVEVPLEVLFGDRVLPRAATALLELGGPEAVVGTIPEQADPAVPGVVLLARREVVAVEALATMAGVIGPATLEDETAAAGVEEPPRQGA